MPTLLDSSLRQLAPACQEVTWDAEGNTFIAQCTDGDFNRQFRFDAKGQCIEQATFLTVDELPEAITAYLESNFPDDEPSIMAKVINAQKNISYNIEIETALAYHALAFDANGKLLQDNKEDLSAEEIDAKVQ